MLLFVFLRAKQITDFTWGREDDAHIYSNFKFITFATTKGGHINKTLRIKTLIRVAYSISIRYIIFSPI